MASKEEIRELLREQRLLSVASFRDELDIMKLSMKEEMKQEMKKEIKQEITQEMEQGMKREIWQELQELIRQEVQKARESPPRKRRCGAGDDAEEHASWSRHRSGRWWASDDWRAGWSSWHRAGWADWRQPAGGDVDAGPEELGGRAAASGRASVEQSAAATGERRPEPITFADFLEAGRQAAAPERRLPRDHRQVRPGQAASQDPPRAAAPQPSAPPPPPGPHWTEYIDREVFWWYYEGPLGKWWMGKSDKSPMPWTED